MDTNTPGFDDDPPPEPRDGWLLVRIHVPELNVYKCLQFPADRLVWDVKQQVLASLPKELKESFNYGLFCPPSNGKAGKFLDEERRLGDYPFNGPVGYLELKYKRRVYKMLNLDERQLKALHTRANLRRFLECINGGHVEKIAKMCAKGLDPNFHCVESGETPLTVATGAKKPNKLLIALVNGGALLDYRTKDGATALHKAVEKDSLEAVTTLLELGASPNYKDGRGITPLYISVTKKCDPKITESLLHDHATLGIQDNQGWQEVHQACRHGLVHHLEHLLFYGADMDGRNASGNTPLHVCAVNNQEASARMLLFRGAQREALNYANQTPYQVAVIAGNLELAEVIQNYKTDDIDKSLGDTSDIISDSSGVGTNSDSAACSIGHPSTTVVCMEPYAGNSVGHIRLQPGDVIEVVGSTDCGLLEGYVRGTNASGFFPVECVQEVNIRQKNITNVSTATSISNSHHQQQQQQPNQKQLFQGSPGMLRQHVPTSNGGGGSYNSSTAPRIKKPVMGEPRTVVLHRAKRGFGFILRGAKASSPLMQLKPSDRFPALQYLDDVDPGGVADMAGLRPGDFLLAIGGEDVRAASHEKVVDMIRSSGALVSMTVISPQHPHQMQSAAAAAAAAVQQHQQFQVQHYQGPSTPQAARQCSTLPRKMSLGQPGLVGSGRMPAPMPPRRDPKTTLSVGRARAKSMVAGLENGGEKDDEDIPAKSSSIESISTTPTQNPSTPVQLRTASIKARPTSSRITAAELEELFQRQQGETADGMNRYSTMMTTSRFQSGTDSGAATPPSSGSPMKGPLVYASVAEMKRKKTKNGTLRGKPCAIPTIGNGGSDLKRFHSTPDLNSHLNNSSSSIWNAIGKGHHSQDDVATLHASMQRLNLPPPTHPPPPPPVGQVVKVDVSRSSSEYESTITLQQKLQKRGDVVDSCGSADGVASSFNPSANAKLYASPQDLRNVVGWKLRRTASQENRQSQLSNQSSNPAIQSASQQPPPAPPQPATQPTHQQQLQKQQSITAAQKCQYAQPTRQFAAQHPAHHQQSQQQYAHSQNGAPLPTGPAPPIPEPDYSLSESDGEDENSILVARNTKLNEKIALLDMPETSGNSHTSGSSSGGSISHSFSVDEIQRIRTNLKTSKSYPNDLLKPENQNGSDAVSQNNNNNNSRSPPNAAENNEEGDNSSSGVSSDQEIPTNPAKTAMNQDTIKKKPSTLSVGIVTPKQHIPLVKQQQPINSSTVAATKVNTLLITSKQLTPALSPAMASKIIGPNLRKHEEPITTVGSTKHNISVSSNNNNHDHDTEEEQRSEDDGELSPSPPAKAFQRHNSLTRKQAASIAMARANRAAVSLVQLPPPIEADSDTEMMAASNGGSNASGNASCTENLVLAPPPQFCDCNDIKHSASGGGANVPGATGNRVRIVGAVPKANRLHSQ